MDDHPSSNAGGLVTWELVDGLAPSDRPRPGLVVAMCGVAGSGKTTYAQELQAAGFHRLSIDQEIWATHGRYGIDYPVADYPELQLQAEEVVARRLVGLVRDEVPVVLDLSLWRRADRRAYRELVEDSGGCWELVHLDVPTRTLRARLRERSRRFDADAAFDVDDAVLDRFLAGFERPEGEGESRLRWVGGIPGTQGRSSSSR